MSERYFSRAVENKPKRAKAMELAQKVDGVQIIAGLAIAPFFPWIGIPLAAGSVATFGAEEWYKRKVIRDEKMKRTQMSPQALAA